MSLIQYFPLLLFEFVVICTVQLTYTCFAIVMSVGCLDIALGLFVQYSILSFNFSYSLIFTVNTLMIELHLKKKVFKYFMIQIDLLVIFTLHNTSVSTSAQEAVDQKKDMDEEDEEDHDESMEDDEDLSEEDMEEDKQGSLAKAAITGRSVTLQMLISEKIIEPGPALLSLKYLVKDYSVPVTVTIYSVTGTLY